MSEPDKSSSQYFAAGLGRGCLVGLAMAVGFLAIGAAIYGIGWAAGLPANIVLMLAVAGGPIIGTVIALVVFYRVAAKASAKYNEVHFEGRNESAPRD